MQRKKGKEILKVERASGLKIGIVMSEYYADMITEKLLVGAMEVLQASHVAKKNIRIIRVPGCFEIPYGCLVLLNRKSFDAIITLGCIVKGETEHDRYIASAVSQGIVDLTREYGVPIAFGVLTVNTLAQAKARSSTKNNKGREAAVAALQAALLR